VKTVVILNDQKVMQPILPTCFFIEKFSVFIQDMHITILICFTIENVWCMILIHPQAVSCV